MSGINLSLAGLHRVAGMSLMDTIGWRACCAYKNMCSTCICWAASGGGHAVLTRACILHASNGRWCCNAVCVHANGHMCSALLVVCVCLFAAGLHT